MQGFEKKRKLVVKKKDLVIVLTASFTGFLVVVVVGLLLGLRSRAIRRVVAQPKSTPAVAISVGFKPQPCEFGQQRCVVSIQTSVVVDGEKRVSPMAGC